MLAHPVHNIDWMAEKFIFSVILLNSVIIYLHVSGVESVWLTIGDLICTFIFLIEMIVKMRSYGWHRYWKDGWNRLDGSLVLLSLPSLLMYVVPGDDLDLSILLILRLLRALRFYRFLHLLREESLTKLGRGFVNGLRSSWPVLGTFLVIIISIGLINCSLFCEASPELFGNPLTSVYTVFQLFTIEGWYEIPKACLGPDASSFTIAVIRLYFSLLLIAGGIIGMSFINSVFVDAMAEDNNDEVLNRINRLETKIDELMKRLDEKK